MLRAPDDNLDDNKSWKRQMTTLDDIQECNSNDYTVHKIVTQTANQMTTRMTS
jgi:hypothetical protein